MSNFELKKKAVEIIKRYFAMDVKVKDIVLLEASTRNGKCDYLFFAVNNSPVSYAYNTSLYNSFCVYPNWDGLNGMQMQWIEE
jgi:hypothetical protein